MVELIIRTLPNYNKDSCVFCKQRKAALQGGKSKSCLAVSLAATATFRGLIWRSWELKAQLRDSCSLVDKLSKRVKVKNMSELFI